MTLAIVRVSDLSRVPDTALRTLRKDDSFRKDAVVRWFHSLGFTKF